MSVVDGPLPYLAISRRRFLQVLAGGVGVLMVGIGRAHADAPPLPPGLLGDNFHALGAYVRIDADGNVLIGARDPDTGTGVATSLPLIIAEEMDADWNRVSVVPLGLDVSDANGQPRWTYGRQLGGTGTSIPAAWADLRPVGALVRWMLLQAAATRLGVKAERLRCESGTVIAPDGRRVTYGSLADAASAVALPSQAPPLKSPQQYRLIGRDAGDVDARAMVTGQLRFAIDERPGDFLVAVLAQCPWPDGTLAELDSKDALAVDGVAKVMSIAPEPGLPWGSTAIAPAVAVLATSTWAALQGRSKLKLTWRPGPSAGEDSGALEQQAARLLDGQTDPTMRVRNDGDVEAAGKHAARRFNATYFQPWLAHATAEPMNCIVRLDKDQAQLVVPTQAPQQAWSVVRRLTGLAPAQIDIQVPRVGGGYGRRLDHDYVAEAVMLAKAVDKTVCLWWTREQDLTHDFYQPGCVHRLEAIVDRRRNVIAWTQRMASASATAHRGIPDARLWTSELRATQMPAALIPNYRSEWYALSSAMPRGPARGAPDVANAFVVECFVDEIAHQLRENPLSFKQRLLGEPRQLPLGDGTTLDIGRLRKVLELVADRIGWKDWLHSVNGLGLACWHLGGAYVAHAVEVAVDGERLVIPRVVCAVDVGRVINPLGLADQVAGATLDAMSNALNLAITFKGGRIQQQTLADYPLATMAQLPKDVEVITVPGDRTPTGASFLAMPSAAPALANAIFRASAVRVRRLPLMAEWERLR